MTSASVSIAPGVNVERAKSDLLSPFGPMMTPSCVGVGPAGWLGVGVAESDVVGVGVAERVAVGELAGLDVAPVPP
jgi:hypothetical protein